MRSNYVKKKKSQVLMLKYIRIFAQGSCKNKPHQIFILDDVKAKLSRHKKHSWERATTSFSMKIRTDH